MAVRDPLSVKRAMLNGRCAKLLIFAIFIISAILQTQRFFGYKVMKSVYGNKTTFCYGFQFNNVNYFMIRISRTVVPFFTVVIPLVLLTVINSCLIYSVRQRHVDVKKMGYVSPIQKVANENKVTKLVLAIVIAFFLFNFPSAVIAILVAVTKNKATLVKLLGYPAQTTNHMVAISKVINFFLYFCCSSKFRKKFKHSLRKRKSIMQSP